MLALSTAATAVRTYGTYQRGQARAKSVAQQRRYQAEEINASAEQEIGKRVRQARAERARMRVAAGEAGVSGRSVTEMLQNNKLKEELDSSTIRKQAGFEQRGSQSRASMASSRIKSPNLALAGLQIGGAVQDYRENSK